MRYLELKIPPVAVFILFGIAMWIAASGLHPVTVSVPGATAAAGLLGAIGIGIGITAVLAFTRRGTTVHPNHPEKASEIVSSGIFRYTRNPMYLGLAIVLTAWAVKLGNLVSFACVPGFIAYMTRFQIVPEERALQEKFGEPFAEYMDTVRRWV